MFWQILGITAIILLIVFFAFTLRILFVFIKGIKKNAVLNKSVSKNVFSGKLSLSIILIFFMVSFGLVGGMQLVNTSGSRTLEKQFDEYSVFQAESRERSIVYEWDNTKSKAAEYYNWENPDHKISDTGFVNDLLIEYTLTTETIKYFNNDPYGYNEIRLNNVGGFVGPGFVEPNCVFKPTNGNNDFFSGLNKETIGWTKYEWSNALEYQLDTTTENWEINKILGGGTSFIDLVVSTFFDNSYTKIGKLLFLYNIYTNPFPEVYKNSPENNQQINIINTFLDELSFKITSYVNATPLNSKGKTDFEFVIINDLDLSKTNGGDSISTNEEDKFIKISEGDRETDEITFIDGVSSTEEFRKLSSMSLDQEKGFKKTYEVLVQEDFLIANNYSIGETIPFGATSTEFKIVGSVRFNEVTYPSMGMNMIPNKKEQAFIGINFSDFLLFAQDKEYRSIVEPEMKMFFGLDSTYDQIDSLPDLIDYTNQIWMDFTDKVYSFSSSVLYLNNSYDSPWEDIYKQAESWMELSDGEVDTNGLMNLLYDSDDLHKNGIFYGWSNKPDSFLLMNSVDSQESVRAIFGLIQIRNMAVMLKIMIGIFLTIVLIVLGMLVNKRIKSSSKQLGTLKAMGMKNKDISSSYILFPIIIICIGFLLASLISPIVMWAFSGLLTQYYYITFSAFALSWWYFIYILFIPLVMSISLAYGMSMWTLRKSTLDLLTNKTNDQPNVMVRTIGYVTPRKTPFAVSYVTKGMFRAVGKSSLLFTAIFLATFLSAFAMSSTTMIKKQTEEIMKYMNYETMQMGIVENRGQYKMEPLYFIGENGKPVPRIPSQGSEWKESDGYYFSYEEIMVNGENINKGSLNPIEMPNQQSKEVISLLYENIQEDTFDIVYTFIHDIVFSPFDKDLLDSDIFNTYYFTDEYMETLFISELSLEYMYNKTHDGKESFSDWEDSQTEDSATPPMTFSRTKSLIEPWAFQVAVNINKSGQLKDKDIKFLEKIRIIKNNTSDLVIGTYYYDQFYEVPNDYMDLGNSHKAINSPNNEDYHELLKDENYHEHNSNMLILNDKESFLNGFGTKENKIGVNIWSNSFEKYFNGGEVKPDLKYIPIVATTQTVVDMNEWVDKGLATVNNDNVYTLSLTIPVEISKLSEPEQKNHSRYNQTILVDVKVEEEIFVGMDFGGVTVKPLFEAYLDNYNYSNSSNSLKYDKDKGGYIFTNNDEEYIIYGNSYKDAFTSNYDQVSTVRNNNNGDNMPKPGSDNYIPSPASFVFTYSGEKNLWWSNQSIITFGNLFSSSGIDTKIGSGIEYTNGFPISMDILLEQGEVAYQLIISMFSIISLFAVFISTTIIIIAMKDIIDSSKREVSMLKAFGYSNTKSTFLILTPYLFVMTLALVISIPMTFGGLAIIAGIFTTLTGNVFVFTLSIIQWIILLGYVASISLVLLFLGYVSFSRTDALEAIKETDE